MCSFMRAIAAEDDETIQFHFFIIGFHRFDLITIFVIGNAHKLEGLAGGAKYRAAQCKDSGEIFRFHQLVIAFD